MLKKLQRGIIVSCQAEEGSSFNNTNSLVSFAKEAERGGCTGFRIRDPENIKAIKEISNLPIIGLSKSYFPESGLVHIHLHSKMAQVSFLPVPTILPLTQQAGMVMIIL